MPSVTIDIAVDIPKIDFDYTEMYQKMHQIAEMSWYEWIRLAQTELKSTSADYISGLTPIMKEGKELAIYLRGWLPNAIENGLEPYDMKPGLLHGPHAKMGKNGPYNTVPFRHGTPGTTGRNVGAPMPVTGTTKTGRPQSLVYNAARKLEASVELPGGKTKWGGKTGGFEVKKGSGVGLGQRTQLPQEGVTFKDGSKSWTPGRPGAYTWKSSPYEGIYKISKTYEKVTQNQYISFRRVSTNSDSNAWWHPGIIAKRFLDRVEQFAREQMQRI